MSKTTNIDPEYVREYRKKLGEQIQAKREESNILIETVAEQVGVTANTICKMELGLYSTGIDLYIKVAIVLNLKISLS